MNKRTHILFFSKCPHFPKGNLSTKNSQPAKCMQIWRVRLAQAFCSVYSKFMKISHLCLVPWLLLNSSVELQVLERVIHNCLTNEFMFFLRIIETLSLILGVYFRRRNKKPWYRDKN